MKLLDNFLVESIGKLDHPSKPCHTMAQHRAQAFMRLYQLFAPDYIMPEKIKHRYRKALTEANDHILGRCKRHIDSNPVFKPVRPNSNQVR